MNRPKQRNLITAFIVLLLLLVTLIVQRIMVLNGSADYPKGTPGHLVSITITKGETGTAIAEDLAAERCSSRR